MWLKHIIALSLTAVALSQKLDNCTVTLNIAAGGHENDLAKAFDCVFPELLHEDCFDRYSSLRVAFRAPPMDNQYPEPRTCNYDVSSKVQISVTDFLNIPAVCSMVGGKMTYATRNECISS
ncbi:MAG: hypothetical protein BYD32DRAFT_410841, partial [Podila humilis]